MKQPFLKGYIYHIYNRGGNKENIFFNKQQGRSGTLFEGTAKHIMVDKEPYLLHVIRYIHYNPVEADLVSQPQDWSYSNYPEWIGIRNGTLVDRNFIKSYFHDPAEYREFMDTYAIEKELEEKLQKYYLE